MGDATVNDEVAAVAEPALPAVRTATDVAPAGSGSSALAVARDRVAEKVNDVVDNWISVPTWGRYCRGMGMHTPAYRKFAERWWNARRA